MQLWSSAKEPYSTLLFPELKICDGNIQSSYGDAFLMLFGVWRTSYAFGVAKNCEWRISLKEISMAYVNG